MALSILSFISWDEGWVSGISDIKKTSPSGVGSLEPLLDVGNIIGVSKSSSSYSTFILLEDPSSLKFEFFKVSGIGLYLDVTCVSMVFVEMLLKLELELS